MTADYSEQLILDGHKLAWHRERVLALLNGERVAPITIDCALTRQCTYRCVYCYGRLQTNKIKPITQDVIFRFLDDAAAIGVKAISLVSDGESTASPYLYDALKRGRNNGLDMALGTNGYLLDDERLEEILPALTYLRFNFSAGQAERYAAIHGCPVACYHKVVQTIQRCVQVKQTMGLGVTIGLQMVLLPEFADQILPLATLGRELEVDYLVIKHCSDDEEGRLGVDYSKYFDLVPLLQQAEAQASENYLVKAKWSKILSGGARKYPRCYGPPLILQLSGSGLVAPCGMLFHRRYQKFHIGNIAEMNFRSIWESERYWQVMRFLASDRFDARKQCGTLCLQHKVNECLVDLTKGEQLPPVDYRNPPLHVNFL